MSKRKSGNSSGTSKVRRYFNELWKVEFLWLDYDGSAMKCQDCVSANVKSSEAFVSGCTNFQRDSLLRHANSVVHKNSVLVVNQKRSWQKLMEKSAAREEKAKIGNPGKVAVMATAYWLAKEEVPNIKFCSLIDLQKHNGNEVLKNCGYAEYKHSTVVNEMQVSKLTFLVKY